MRWLRHVDDGPDRRGEQLFTPVPEARETVMLNAIEGRARERGWIVLSVRERNLRPRGRGLASQ